MTNIIASTARPRTSGEIEKLTAEEETAIDREISHYPNKQAATIEALKIVQKHQRWVSDGKVKAIAQKLDMSPDAVDAVATFYNRIYRKPVGEKVLAVCDSVSCWLLDYPKIMAHLCERLNIQPGQTSEDNQYTLIPTPCLGACDKAPVMLVEDERIENLTEEKLDQLLGLKES